MRRLPALVHVETLEGAVLILHLNEARAGFHQAPGQQQPMREAIAVKIGRVQQRGFGDLRLIGRD